MSYVHELLSYTGPLDYFFAQHLQHVVQQAFKDTGILSERRFDNEFDYICYVLSAYYHAPINISVVAELFNRHQSVGLALEEKIVVAEITLLTCGFFRRQSLSRGRRAYPLKFYMTMAQQLYLEIRNFFPSKSYERVGWHFKQWTRALDLLAMRFEEQQLPSYVIRIEK